jgi:PAS domain S-box-containing protein
MLICRVFLHSPVFRIGGDEFVVTLRGEDYENRENLVSTLRAQVEENIRIGEGPVVASGLAEYRPRHDRSVEDVFNRADSQMYEDKMRLKERKFLKGSHVLKDKANNLRIITEERRVKLDALYNAFEELAEDSYVFLCDMKYDFSRWSKNAVDIYGLPSEYMYGAEDIWENLIHPEDRNVYHRDVDELLSGDSEGHDVQYRAKRLTGEYDLCSCHVVMIRDSSGEPDYYVGNIHIQAVK